MAAIRAADLQTRGTFIPVEEHLRAGVGMLVHASAEIIIEKAAVPTVTWRANEKWLPVVLSRALADYCLNGNRRRN
jgi:hypothetical protein